MTKYYRMLDQQYSPPGRHTTCVSEFSLWEEKENGFIHCLSVSNNSYSSLWYLIVMTASRKTSVWQIRGPVCEQEGVS